MNVSVFNEATKSFSICWNEAPPCGSPANSHVPPPLFAFRGIMCHEEQSMNRDSASGRDFKLLWSTSAKRFYTHRRNAEGGKRPPGTTWCPRTRQGAAPWTGCPVKATWSRVWSSGSSGGGGGSEAVARGLEWTRNWALVRWVGERHQPRITPSSNRWRIQHVGVKGTHNTHTHTPHNTKHHNELRYELYFIIAKAGSVFNHSGRLQGDQCQGWNQEWRATEYWTLHNPATF